MRQIIKVLLFVFAVLAVGCGDDNPTQSSPASYRFEDFVNFDTTEIVMQVATFEYLDIEWSEPVLDWEEPMVEPWEPGLPFDDINGDGVRSIASGTYSNVIPGLPYCDINGNGHRDSAQPYFYFLSRWDQTHYAAGDDFLNEYSRAGAPAVYRFISDSGFVYEIPVLSYLRKTILSEDGRGLFFYRDPQNDDFPLMILDTGEISEVTDEIYSADSLPEPIEYHKTLKLRESRTIEGRDFSDLVIVSIIADYENYFGDTLEYSEYIFQRNKGLIGRGYGDLVPNGGDTLRSISYDCYLDPIENNDSLIFDMTF